MKEIPACSLLDLSLTFRLDIYLLNKMNLLCLQCHTSFLRVFITFLSSHRESAPEGGKNHAVPSIHDKKHVIWRIHFNERWRQNTSIFRKYLEKLTKMGDSIMMNNYLLHWTKSNELTCQPCGSLPLPHLNIFQETKGQKNDWDAKTIINKWEAGGLTFSPLFLRILHINS